MKTQILSLAAAAALVTATPVAAGYAGAYQVYPAPGGAFEVVSTITGSPAFLWCGAGEHAIAQLGAGSTERVYIQRGVGPSVNDPSNRSVIFSLTPPPSGAVRSNSIDVSLVGNNLSAGAAWQYCFNRNIKD